MKTTRLTFEEHQIECHHQGAHISSWIYKEQEQLFLSKNALFSDGKAIRGGVPICFPQFGAFGNGHKHGFARNVEWALKTHLKDTLIFSLNDESASKYKPAFKFDALFTVKIQEKSLKMQLEVTNNDISSAKFTAALHTYFKVGDIEKVSIKGLTGCNYWNNGEPLTQKHQQISESLTIHHPIDRVYFNATSPLELIKTPHSLRINSAHFRDVVIWNPWQEGAEVLPDMANNEYRNMLCIEAANVGTPTQLKPNETWVGEQSIHILD